MLGIKIKNFNFKGQNQNSWNLDGEIYIYIYFFFERDGEDFLLWKNCEFKIYGAINNQSMVQSITNHKIPSFVFSFLMPARIHVSQFFVQAKHLSRY